jgi:hypothetical protein
VPAAASEPDGEATSSQVGVALADPLAANAVTTSKAARIADLGGMPPPSASVHRLAYDERSIFV